MSGVVWLWSIEHHNYWLLGRPQQWSGVLSCKCSPAHQRSRYMFGTHQIFTLIWVCLCRVEFPHISQFLLMLALRVRLAALELTSLVTHGIILPSSLLPPPTHHRTPRSVLINIQEGDRCEVWLPSVLVTSFLGWICFISGGLSY